MSIPISNGEICQFVLEKQFMDYFTVQEYLTELVTSKYLDVTNDVENNVTRYTITDDGSEVISLFFNSIPEFARTEIVQYVHENERRIKQDEPSYKYSLPYFGKEKSEFSRSPQKILPRTFPREIPGKRDGRRNCPCMLAVRRKNCGKHAEKF